MSRKKTGREKGKGLSVSGIPFGGAISQIEEGSAEPNRIEATNAFKEDQEASDSRAYDKRDYIGDEVDNLGNADVFIANKDDEVWSDGLEDEANIPLFEDDGSDQGLFPEIQPLHVDLASTAGLGGDDNLNVILRPDTIDNQSDDFTDLDDRVFEAKNRKRKSA
jgi:hypothetical protein